MDTLACVKRVPDTGAKIVLTDDQQRIDTSSLGFTMSPHEECAVEEAVQVSQEMGGSATALTLGGEESTEQLRTALAMQADAGVLLETDGDEWGPVDTANAIAEYVRGHDDGFDLLLFGNESADAGNYQVPVRVARALDLPVVTGIKDLSVADGTVTAKREVSRGSEVYELDLPCVVAVREGLNEPRYPSMRAKMKARRQELERVDPVPAEMAGGLEKVRLEAPETAAGSAEILGEGPEAVDEVVRVLADDLEVI